MPLPSDYTNSLVEGGAIKLVKFTRDPPTIEPGQTSLLEWRVDAGSFVVVVKLEGEVVGTHDQKRVQPTFTRTYNLYVSSQGTDDVTLGSRAVNVDLSKCALLPVPLDEITSEVSREVEDSLKDNGFPDAKVRSVQLTGEGNAARAETGTLKAVTVIAVDLLGIPYTCTIHNTFDTTLKQDGSLSLTSPRTSVNLVAHPTNILQSVATEGAQLFQFESLAEGVLSLAIQVALGESLDDAVDDATSGVPGDWLYAIVLGSMKMYLCPSMVSQPEGATPMPAKPSPTKVDTPHPAPTKTGTAQPAPVKVDAAQPPSKSPRRRRLPPKTP
ncbi:MAG: hypothetical protein U0359_18590 [Byssovorax sp.]